jgi:hypothetical protein
MGHTRLGSIPKSRKWSAVVGAIAGAEPSGGRPHVDPDPIAARTLEAARAGLDRCIEDRGLQFTFYVLTQLVLAARHPDWHRRLQPFGIELAENATIFDLTAEIQSAIDEHVASQGPQTDVGEMAQRAAGSAIADTAGPKATTLFGGGAEDVRLAVRELSTREGFAELGQRFFGEFMARFLNFYLSRITADQVGRSLRDVGDVSEFNRALETHCRQSAYIVRDYCGQWYSTTEFREGISLAKTSRFMAVAIRKLQAELERQERE